MYNLGSAASPDQADRVGRLVARRPPRFPAAARNEAGHQLHRVQCGLEPIDWKPMKSLGVGVSEVRIRTGREHRVFFLARFAEAVYVLHAFEKKSGKTARIDLEVGAQRLRAVLEQRARRRGDA
ncbi:MAG: type II toxin-antitoxin system RelE/ParE family toxin [bacterium]